MAGSGGVLGGITDFVGITDFEGAERKELQSQNSKENAVRVARDAIATSKENFDQLNSIFGGVEKRLSTYFNNLNIKDEVDREIQILQRNKQRINQNITKTLAGRGLRTDSKFSDYLKTQADVSFSQKQSEIEASLPRRVATEQLNFLTLGLNARQNALGRLNADRGGLASIYSGQALNEERIGASIGASSRDEVGTLVGAGLGKIT